MRHVISTHREAAGVDDGVNSLCDVSSVYLVVVRVAVLAVPRLDAVQEVLQGLTAHLPP